MNDLGKFEHGQEGTLAKTHPAWKGDKVGYTALHQWVRRHLQKPKMCVDCKISPPRDIANISQKYKRDLSDWEWLCRRCHMVKDGRLQAAKTVNIGRIQSETIKTNLRTKLKEMMPHLNTPPAINSRKTHCLRGHMFNKKNTRYDKNGRRCRLCKNEYERNNRKTIKN